MNRFTNAKPLGGMPSQTPPDGVITELLEAVPYMVCLCHSGRLGYINPAGLRLLGLESPAQAAGM